MTFSQYTYAFTTQIILNLYKKHKLQIDSSLSFCNFIDIVGKYLAPPIPILLVSKN